MKIINFRTKKNEVFVRLFLVYLLIEFLRICTPGHSLWHRKRGINDIYFQGLFSEVSLLSWWRLISINVSRFSKLDMRTHFLKKKKKIFFFVMNDEYGWVFFFILEIVFNYPAHPVYGYKWSERELSDIKRPFRF